MPIRGAINTFRNIVLPAVLNSYSVIFFFNNKLLALVMLLVTFFNFFSGLSGLIAVFIAVLIANSMGLEKSQLKKGLFSFNALLVGLGMGTFFDPSWVFFSLLLLAALLTLILSVTMASWLGKYGLPVLSIPFVVAFWFVVLPSSQFENLGLTQRNIYWMNDVYAFGGNSMLNFLQNINSLPINKMVDIYLRSMSSIFFQDNLIAGLFVTLALLYCSRIAFSLSVIGFVSAYFFAQFSGSTAASITYYNIGANYIMVAIAVGGFLNIPSRFSYLWAVLLVPLTSLVLLFMSKLLGIIHLPAFSLPFAFVVIFFTYFLLLRAKSTKLVLTPFQYYSPEMNLYAFNNNKERISSLYYFPLYLPFWGEWKVTQGHDGKHTHKDEWGKAFDFMLVDGDSKTFSSNGLICEDYYCYSKPILAPADGIVEEIIDQIDDNEIGKVNTVNNWGNTIIIRHLYGLYTQMSHLKKGSFRVRKGDFVQRGDLLALCGNSGRSPEPHLHFQVQTMPLLGYKTLDFPFGYFNNKSTSGSSLRQFAKPKEGELVSGITNNPILKKAFDILPNSVLKFQYADEKGMLKTIKWEAYTDAYNYKYLYCQETESYAYYVNDGTMFYFTAFYGNKESLLYYFYLSAYKVFLGNSNNLELYDDMPLTILRNKKPSIWLHDFIAPFHCYIRATCSVITESFDNQINTDEIILNSKIQVSVFGKSSSESNSAIWVSDTFITAFSYKSSKINIKAKCVN
jgi:urea transporter/murein DD-endopeptidase MepM/ murein hydrolase activator NlpD